MLRRGLLIVAAAAGSAAYSPLPSHVSGYAVEPSVSTWAVPGGSRVAVQCCIVSNDPDADGLYSTAHVDHPQSRVRSELDDPYGVLGVWPSAYVAVARLSAAAAAGTRGRRLRVLELGAGAGLPSLYAASVLGAEVVATDIEGLPLAFLDAAHRCAGGDGTLRTAVLDVEEATPADVAGFDVVVAADMLYHSAVAEALGALLAQSQRSARPPALVVCDPGRVGRADFLEAFGGGRFVDVPVPPECAAVDVFDGSAQLAVGVFELS
jgi:predicted nicotinamide N-methyase